MGVFVAIEVDGIVRWALVFHRLHRPCIGVILSAPKTAITRHNLHLGVNEPAFKYIPSCGQRQPLLSDCLLCL